MGEQHSKTSQQKQSTDCQTDSSSSSIQQQTLTQFISNSPEKLQQVSRTHKIQTSCFLKYSQINNVQNVQIQCVNKRNEFYYLLEIISSTYDQIDNNDHQTQDLNIPQENYQRNPDIDRIDGLFQRNGFKQNYNQFLMDSQLKQDQDRNLILNWKNSVNKILNLTYKYHDYFQGHLLICAIMRLYLSQNTTLKFLNKLLQKVGKLISQNEEYNIFNQKLNLKCKQLCPKTYQKLQQNDLDFQSVYANWILGLFSNTLSKQTCIKVWYQLSICDKPYQKLQEFIIQCMKFIEDFVVKIQKQNLLLDQNCFHFQEISLILSKFTITENQIIEEFENDNQLQGIISQVDTQINLLEQIQL